MSIINTLWLVLCGAMVLFMQAGFAMLETGLTRAKNAGNIVLKNIMDICIGAPLFTCIGFGIMYGHRNGWIGTLDLTLSKNYSNILPDGISLGAWVFFQLVFCATAATIVSGAMAERTKFAAYCIYSAVISMVVYPIIGHWIWGGGWLAELGFHDFAGGTVVHTVGGVSAFVGACLVGPRLGKYSSKGKIRAIPGHNITLSALGVLILWFGWFGFNGGSLLSQGPDALSKVGNVFLNTCIAACVSAFFAMITSKLKLKKADITMIINGLLVGLVSITAGCDQVGLIGSICIGAITGTIMVLMICFVEQKIKVDDPVGACVVHGIGGMLGTILTGLFSVKQGLFYTGQTLFFITQLFGTFVVCIVTAVVMFCVFRLIDITVGLRVDKTVEMEGLDICEHGLKSAYGDFYMNDYVTALDSNEETESHEIEEESDNQKYSTNNLLQSDRALYKVEIILKQNKFESLKFAMNHIGVTGMTVSQVLGCGVQKGKGEDYRGAEVDIQLLPKIKVEIVIAQVPVEKVVEAARRVLYSGHIGDGKIFVYDVKNAIKVRTGATGYDAMQGLQD